MNVYPYLTENGSDHSSIEVMVFRTNLSSIAEIRKVTYLLDAIPCIVTWSVDTEDIDKVLRVETTRWCPEEIIKAVSDAGYFCEELTD